MDNLAERLKQVSDESWETWFDRWYKKCDWERSLITMAQKGQSGTIISVDKKEEYIQRMLIDGRFIPKMENMLGTGIKVSLEIETRTDILGRRSEERFIVIKW